MCSECRHVYGRVCRHEQSEVVVSCRRASCEQKQSWERHGLGKYIQAAAFASALCIGMCINMCVDMCVWNMYIATCVDTSIDACVDTCIATYADRRIAMCIGMCTDMSRVRSSSAVKGRPVKTPILEKRRGRQICSVRTNTHERTRVRRMHVDMCVDIVQRWAYHHANRHMYGHAHGHAHGHAYGHVHGHAFRHVHGQVHRHAHRRAHRHVYRHV